MMSPVPFRTVYIKMKWNDMKIEKFWSSWFIGYNLFLRTFAVERKFFKINNYLFGLVLNLYLVWFGMESSFIYLVWLNLYLFIWFGFESVFIYLDWFWICIWVSDSGVEEGCVVYVSERLIYSSIQLLSRFLLCSVNWSFIVFFITESWKGKGSSFSIF